MANPALRQRGQDVRIVLFDGSADTVPGVVRNAETTAGESAQAFGDFGPVAWLDYDGDESQIEFVRYGDPSTGQRLHRLVIKRERVGTIFATVKVNLTVAATVLPALRGDYSARDFDPRDFNTGTP